ncbi:MAG TPA: hypothetical protein VGN16_09670 [Acidobacteriaceae bacterium]
MADLLIRYISGRRIVCIDHRGPSRHECVLHDKSRERRVPLTPEMAALSLDKLLLALDRASEGMSEVESEEKMIELKCEGCGKVEGFANGEEAFVKGWDCPPRFITHVTCGDCGIETTAWFKMMSDNKKEA